MTSHPFDQPMPLQLASMEHGMSLLRAFADAYPVLANPWAVSPLAASVYYPSHSIADVGRVLGKEGWTIERTIIHKEVMGCRIEISLPVKARGFEWEGVGL